MNHFGDRVTNESFLGRYALLFFGFTHCRVVCPTNLARISRVMDAIGALADKIQPLYVSVDPERDTPEVMRVFLAANYPQFIGLTGTRAQVDHMKTAYKVFARKIADEAAPDGYDVPHTALTYLIDPQGRYASHFSDGIEDDEMLARLCSVLAPCL